MRDENFTWDFFLAHASADTNAAETLYELLEPHSRVFVDTRCLKLGDDWDIELARAQRKSRITVVIISTNTESPYYQREEIAAALAMARENANKHRVVPVFLNGQPTDELIPYGLRLKHGLYVSDVGSLQSIAQKLLELLSQIDDLRRYVEITQSDSTIASVFKECFHNFENAEEWIRTKNIPYKFLSFASQRYTNRIEDRCGAIRIFGMGKPENLRRIFTRVSILEKITARQRVTVEQLEEYFDRDRRGFGIRRETKDGIEVVNKYSRFILLGKPGAGKTTFLKYIALHALDGKLLNRLVPIFVELKDLSDKDITLIDFIVDQFEDCQFPQPKLFVEHLLESGKCIVLLDGLDEVSKAKEDSIVMQVRDLSSKYNNNQFVLSCRVAAYNYYFDRFTDVEVADFSDERVYDFIHNWFGRDTKTSELCWRKLNENASIKELASIPLLLTLLCLAFEELMDFPKNRAELYKESLDALLKKWDTSRLIKREEIYKNLSLRNKENMFSRIAFNTFANDRYFFPQRTLEKYIADFIENLPDTIEDTLEVDSEIVLKAIEAHHGLFVERATGIYSFSHLTFQEYFTAKYIVDNASKGTLSDLVKQQLFDDKWREVFLITSGMLVEADDFLLLIKKKIDTLIQERNVAAFLRSIRISIIKQDAIFSSIGDRSIGFTSIIAVVHSLDLARNISRKLTPKLVHALDLAFERARELAQALNLSFDKNLEGVLDRAFAQGLARSIALNLSQEQISLITAYIKGNTLLVNCLKSECYISKATRQGILDTLFDVPVRP